MQQQWIVHSAIADRSHLMAGQESKIPIHIWHGRANTIEPGKAGFRSMTPWPAFFVFSQGGSMDFSEAIDWVRSNEGLIKKTLCKYYMYSPYEEHDYMQDAFESAMVAVLKSERKRISFESAFWQDFRKNLSLVTPNMNSSRYGSNSVPSCLCSDDIDLTIIAQREETPELDLEAIFKNIRRHLTERENSVFTLALGFTDKGTLTNYEIAERLKCSPTNVRDAYNKAFERIKRLVGEGVINPRTLRLSARINSNGGCHDEYR